MHLSQFSKWFPADADLSYERRLQAVRELGELFPGYRPRLGYANRRLGLFAGIYLQTRWQRDSGRDRVPHWFFVNQSLTLAPLAYANEFLANPGEPCEESHYVRTHPTRDAATAPLTQVDTCRAWKAYFRAATRGARKSELRRLLWRAHTTSIRHALWQFELDFASAQAPPQEVRFWRGWITLVIGLERPAPATTDLALRPLLACAMPAAVLVRPGNGFRTPCTRQEILTTATVRVS